MARRLAISCCNLRSPAAKESVQPGEEIAEVEGAKATVKALSDALAARKPGDHLRVKLANGGKMREVEFVLAANPIRTYKFRKAEQADAQAAPIWKDWMRDDRKTAN